MTIYFTKISFFIIYFWLVISEELTGKNWSVSVDVSSDDCNIFNFISTSWKSNAVDISGCHVYFCEAFARQGVRLTLLRRFLPAGHNELQGTKQNKTYIPYRLISWIVSIAEYFANLYLYFGCPTRYWWRKSYPWRASAWKQFSWLRATRRWVWVWHSTSLTIRV